MYTDFSATIIDRKRKTVIDLKRERKWSPRRFADLNLSTLNKCQLKRKTFSFFPLEQQTMVAEFKVNNPFCSLILESLLHQQHCLAFLLPLTNLKPVTINAIKNVFQCLFWSSVSLECFRDFLVFIFAILLHHYTISLFKSKKTTVHTHTHTHTHVHIHTHAHTIHTHTHTHIYIYILWKIWYRTAEYYLRLSNLSMIAHC